MSIITWTSKTFVDMLLGTKILLKNDYDLYLYIQSYCRSKISTLQYPFKHAGISIPIVIDKHYRNTGS